MIFEDIEGPTETKTCSKCGKEKRITLFNRNKSNPDGLSAYCKRCNREYLQERRERIKQRKHLIRTNSLEAMKK